MSGLFSRYQAESGNEKKMFKDLQNMFVKLFKKPAPAKRGVWLPAGPPEANKIEK
jgi:hypothetical protein